MNVAELSSASPASSAPADIDGFRAGLRAWLDGHDLSPGPDRSLDGQVAQLARVRRALWDAGWMRYGWPVSVGGLGGPAMLRAVLGEEVASRDLAEPGIYSMIEVLAPTVISYAPPPLAAQMVPRLLSGAEQWCQGFSEPGSGSDLASLATRAVPRGDGWVVSGQKVWTSLAQYAARCVLLARTAPGHGGITAFFADMDAPGITVRPLRTMHGVDEFAEVFFDNVVVPGDRLLGRPGDGWRVATDLLPYERSTCFWHRIAYLYTRLDRLLARCPARPGLAPAWRRLGFGDAALGPPTWRCTSPRCRSLAHPAAAGCGRAARAGDVGRQGAAGHGRAAAVRHRAGPAARSARAATDSPWRSEYLFSRAATIYGGTAEIQRNIIARRLLGLGKD